MTGVSQREEWNKEAERWFQEIIVKMSPNLKKEMCRNSRRSTTSNYNKFRDPRQIIIKLLKSWTDSWKQDKSDSLHIRELLKRQSWFAHQKPCRPEESGSDTFKCWKKTKTTQLENCIGQSCHSKNEREHKTLPDKQKLRHFITTRQAL